MIPDTANDNNDIRWCNKSQQLRSLSEDIHPRSPESQQLSVEGYVLHLPWVLQLQYGPELGAWWSRDCDRDDIVSSVNIRIQNRFANEANVFRLQKGLEDKGYEEWVGEMIGMREILKHFSNISTGEVVGMRAPYLKPGRNTQYKVLEDFGYIYDSSIGISPLKVPIWPYTLDYKIPHECKAGTCPTKSFQGNSLVRLNLM